MKYKVSSISNSGSAEKKERLIDAQDKAEVFDMLRAEGSTPISVIEHIQGWRVTYEKINNAISIVKMQEKILFSRNLGSMIEAGLSLSRALFVIEKQSSNNKFKNIIVSIQNEIKQGNSLSSALSKHPLVFSKIFVAMVRAGEEGGSMAESLKTLSLQMEKTYTLRRKIKGALMYPGIILSVMIIIGILMLIFVVPTLTQTFKELEIDLPLSTRSVIFVSDFMKDHTIIFLAGIIGIITGIFAWRKTPQGKRSIDFLLLHTPLISSLVKETNSARTARTLGSLLSSGIDVVNAISITKDVVVNSYYKEVLNRAGDQVQKGITLSEIFKDGEDVYPIFVSEMISVGEETGKLPEMLEKIAIFYEDDIDQKTKNMSTIIEPFLMVFIGIVVGFFALSMITPTYSLVDGL
jgi:type IV pilus assembly protein PilC